jgi:hypothetical protein
MKFWLSAIFFVMSFNLQAAPILPFVDWDKERKNWMADKSELSYALTRCGSLYSVVGIYFIANTANGDSSDGRKLLEFGRVFLDTGGAIAADGGMSINAIGVRHESLQKIYVETVKSNKAVHNNIFYGWVGADFEFCADKFERLFK